jgi:hypothetical protein
VFQRFTDRARGAISSAQEEAHSLGQERVGSDHILLGLLVENEGLAGQVLQDLGVEAPSVRSQIAETDTSADADAQRHLPFTTPARMTIERALRQSLSLGQNFVGTEHLLLGLLLVDDSRGGQILEGMGLDYERARAEILRRSPGQPNDLGQRSADGRPGRVSPARDPYTAVIKRLERRGHPAPEMSTVRILKERALADRRFFAITYGDARGGQHLLLAGAKRNEDGFWSAGSGGGGARPAPQREGRWVYLEGWHEDGHLCLGGELLIERAQASEVHLVFEDGMELVDDFTDGVVLFVAERAFGPSPSVQVHDSAGNLLVSHPLH